MAKSSSGRSLIRLPHLPFPPLLPMVGLAALASAITFGLIQGGDGATGGANGFVEALSGDSSTFIGDLGILAPLGFAFIAGAVSAVNPCGFAMLPAYLGLYLGANEDQRARQHIVRRLGRALFVGGVVTGGFMLLFGVAGLVIGGGAQGVVDALPWIGLTVGGVLAVVGSWMLAGGKLYTGVAGRVAARIGNPSEVSIKGYFTFGLSYGIASLSCTLPIFLAVVGTSLAVSDVPSAVGQLVLYALGMGFIITVLTISMAVFKGAMVGVLRTTLAYVQPMSAALMVVAGSYIVYYWLTIGGLP